MERKAAFQLSLGFIIAVVFAIVLLSLALTWLRGTIENIIGLTDDLSQEAQANLRDAFRTGTTNFAVWPSSYDIMPGKKVRMSSGIQNNAPDGKDHQFVIDVVPVSADDGVLSASSCSSFDSCATLKAEMGKWTTFDQTAGRILINAHGFKFIEISPAANAVKGTYLYNVIACYDRTSTGGTVTPASTQCTETSNNLWGGSAQQLLISVV